MCIRDAHVFQSLYASIVVSLEEHRWHKPQTHGYVGLKVECH